MPLETDVRALLDRVRRKDESAARTLVEHLYAQVLRIVRAHRPQRIAEEDLSQEVFMSVFADLEHYRGQVPFEHWVSRIAVTTCLDALRREKARPELRWADLSPEEAQALESMHHADAETWDGERAHARELVGKLLDTLTPRDRLLVQWLSLEERSVAEVMALTGWGASRVKVQAFRARRQMRHALEKLMETKS